MFIQYIFFSLFLAVTTFNGFFSIPTLGTECHLYRCETDDEIDTESENSNKRVLLKYTDEICRLNCKYYLNYDVDRALSSEVYGFGVADVHQKTFKRQAQKVML